MLELLPKQKTFIKDVKTPYLAYVGGFRAGKTFSAVIKALHLSTLTPNTTGILMEPTFSMVKDSLLPVVDMVMADYTQYYNDQGYAFNYELKTGHAPELIIQWEQGPSRIIMRSAENHRRLRGITASWAGVDEIDTIDEDLVNDAWISITSRVSTGNYMQKFVTTTPEGYKWTYKFFEQQINTDKKLIRVSMRENPHLPPGYVEEQEKLYDARLAEAYIDGLFVNLYTGVVYYAFDRNDNATTLTLEDFPDHVLHIGMDFNVNHMSAITHIVKDQQPHALDEIQDLANTEALINEIKRRYPNRKIYIYPDSSGQKETSNASVSDITLLKNAGFTVRYPRANPRIINRVASMNAMFRNAKNEVRYRINTEKCPKYMEALEMQTYDKSGKPEKKHDIDHPVDAAGYFIHYQYPLKTNDRKRVTIRNG